MGQLATRAYARKIVVWQQFPHTLLSPTPIPRAIFLAFKRFFGLLNPLVQYNLQSLVWLRLPSSLTFLSPSPFINQIFLRRKRSAAAFLAPEPMSLSLYTSRSWNGILFLTLTSLFYSICICTNNIFSFFSRFPLFFRLGSLLGISFFRSLLRCHKCLPFHIYGGSV